MLRKLKKFLTYGLDRLNATKSIGDMNISQLRLHHLKGKEMGEWAVIVSGNYRITFRFVNGRVEGVDFCDYH